VVTSLKAISWREALANYRKSAAPWSREETFAYYAVNSAMHRVWRARTGTREETLNGECYALGRLVGAGWTTLSRAALVMEHAIRTNRAVNEHGQTYVQEHGVEYVRWKILRALNDGMAKPYPALGR
jgi:hypothetical protein